MDPYANVLPLPTARPRSRDLRETSVEATVIPTSVMTSAFRRIEIALWFLTGTVALAGGGVIAALVLR
jgi:hypothetical protein